MCLALETICVIDPMWITMQTTKILGNVDMQSNLRWDATFVISSIYTLNIYKGTYLGTGSGFPQVHLKYPKRTPQALHT